MKKVKLIWQDDEYTLGWYDDAFETSPVWLFGSEFGLDCAIRAEHECAAYEVYVDEFADVEDNLPSECEAMWVNGETCDCHEIAPNGARTVDGSPFRHINPHLWFRQYDGLYRVVEVAEQ